MSTTVVQHPAGVSSAHACERCEQFVVHLDESLGEGRQSDLKKVIPNQSQRRLAERIFGAQDDLPGDLKDLKRNIFFEATYGYSLFDVDLEELRRYSREGCSLSSHLMRCMDDRRISLWDLPPKSVLGLKVLNAHSVEFGLLFVQSWSWILFKPFHDPDKFTMLAFPDDPAASLVDNFPLNPLPGSLTALRQTKDWLHQCLTHDQSSHSTAQHEFKKEYMPTRLLQIVRGREETYCRLLEYIQGAPRPYACLSYCWGGEQNFKVTSHSITQYQERIVIEALPQTLQDAIRVTDQLGIEFLWVDTLCIIQDSETDETHEIGQMARVYGNATVTIAASRATTVWDGFLGERCALGFDAPDLSYSIISEILAFCFPTICDTLTT